MSSSTGELNQKELATIMASWLHESGNHLHALSGWTELYEKKAIKNGKPNQEYFQRILSIIEKLVVGMDVLRDFSVLLESPQNSDLSKEQKSRIVEVLSRKIRKELRDDEVPGADLTDAEIFEWFRDKVGKYNEIKNTDC